MNYSQIASKESLKKAVHALEQNGIEVIVANDKDAAKEYVLGLVPESAEVMTYTSKTLDEVGISEEINLSGKFNSIRTKLGSLDRDTQKLEMNRLGAAPEIAVGSVHAVTENGEVIIASNTGSQLPAYAYGAEKVIWVVGTQKIVEDLEDGMKRLYEYTLPLESQRAHEAYGVEKSNVSKILTISKEVVPGRITIVFIEENIGF